MSTKQIPEIVMLSFNLEVGSALGIRESASRAPNMRPPTCDISDVPRPSRAVVMPKRIMNVVVRIIRSNFLQAGLRALKPMTGWEERKTAPLKLLFLCAYRLMNFQLRIISKRNAPTRP